jgi:hypothetical protein
MDAHDHACADRFAIITVFLIVDVGSGPYGSSS